jgi:hypothetical protein
MGAKVVEWTYSVYRYENIIQGTIDGHNIPNDSE